MSAQTVSIDPTPEETPSRQLRVVPSAPGGLSSLGFFLFIGALVVVGLTAVMITSTQVAAQGRELRELQDELRDVSFAVAHKQGELAALSSPGALAERARQLGMVPNPHPVFLDLADGSVTGEPAAVNGREAEWMYEHGRPTPGQHVQTGDGLPTGGN